MVGSELNERGTSFYMLLLPADPQPTPHHPFANCIFPGRNSHRGIARRAFPKPNRLYVR
jgi:hypothetical protein